MVRRRRAAQPADPGIVHTYLTLAAEAVDPAHPAHDFFQARFTQTRWHLRDAITDEQISGSFRSTVDPDTTARALIAASDGLQLQALIDPTIDAAADLQAVIDALRR